MSSIASFVPEPMEKWAVCAASPIKTTLPWLHRLFVIVGNVRHAEPLISSFSSPRSSAKILSQNAADSASSTPFIPRWRH